jgi:23S rRNA (uracil1939-C5)-methyltransferase
MKKPAKDEILELDIQDIGFEGKGIARTNDDFVIFVKNTIPGDIVKARVKKIKKNLAEATLVEIIKESVNRITHKCPYFGICNGCKMQNADYNFQLEMKRNTVKNAFERIGGFDNLNIPQVIGSENIYYYRNKLEFSFSNQRWLTEADMGKTEDKNFALGFHMPGFIDKVLDINNCSLQSEISNKILNLTGDFYKKRNETIYTTKTHSGYLRYLVIRQSAFTNDLMVNLITHNENRELISEYADLLKKEVPEITTFVNSISTAKSQVAQADYFNTIFGNGYINEKIGSYSFKITPFSFFQTNTSQAKALFDAVIRLADFNKDENVLDLYCGTGAISIYISEYVRNILGVELSEESIQIAKENAELNNVNNCEFISSDVKEYLSVSIPAEAGTSTSFDTFILDPPRSGVHPKSAEHILNMEPKKIIYVSCNPSTQARDIKLLEEKYKITAMQPVDMFPHTFHIENVARLDRKRKN